MPTSTSFTDFLTFFPQKTSKTFAKKQNKAPSAFTFHDFNLTQNQKTFAVFKKAGFFAPKPILNFSKTFRKRILNFMQKASNVFANGFWF